jgi:hypothetical protein
MLTQRASRTVPTEGPCLFGVDPILWNKAWEAAQLVAQARPGRVEVAANTIDRVLERLGFGLRVFEGSAPQR